MSSSSDTDEEEKKKLLESVSGVNFEAKKETSTNEGRKTKKKSLRSDLQEETEVHVLQTTPEFRAFISKKLESFLDSEISEKEYKRNVHGDDVDNGSGIKLLAYSEVTLSDGSLKPTSKKKRKPSTSSSSEDDDETLQRFKSAAVTMDFIAKEAEKYRQNDENTTGLSEVCGNLPEDTIRKTKKKKKKKE